MERKKEKKKEEIRFSANRCCLYDLRANGKKKYVFQRCFMSNFFKLCFWPSSWDDLDEINLALQHDSEKF